MDERISRIFVRVINTVILLATPSVDLHEQWGLSVTSVIIAVTMYGILC